MIIDTIIRVTLTYPDREPLDVEHAETWTLDNACEYVRVVRDTLPAGATLRVEIVARATRSGS